MKKALAVLIIVSISLVTTISVSLAELMDRNTFLALFMATYYITDRECSVSPVKDGTFMLFEGEQSLVVRVNADSQIVGFLCLSDSPGLLMDALGCLDSGYSEFTVSGAERLLPRSETKKEMMLKRIVMDVLFSGQNRFNTAWDGLKESNKFTDDLFEYGYAIVEGGDAFFLVDVKEAISDRQ